jgi:uncharacterized membrane protein YjjP (DUF1212 family)
MLSLSSKVRCLELLTLCGASTHRIEQIGERLCDTLGWSDVQIAVFPSMLTVTFNAHSDSLVTRSVTCRLIRGFSLNKMEEMDAFLEAVSRGVLTKRTLAAIALKVQNIMPLYGKILNWLAVAALNGSSAVAFFNLGLSGAVITTLIGLVIIGPLNLVAWRFPNFALLIAPVSAIFSGFIVRSAAVLNLLPRACISGTHLSAIVTFAPGIPLAIAALELGSKSVVSGASRLISALVVAFSIGIGLNIGDELALLFDPSPVFIVGASKCTSVSLWWLFLSFPLFCASLFIVLDAPIRRWAIMICCASLAFFSMFGFSYSPFSANFQLRYSNSPFFFFSSFLPCRFRNAIVAAAVGAFGSLYSCMSKLPSSTVIYTGIVLLVPGSLAVNVLHQSVGGVFSFGVSFLEIAISISIGLLIASVPQLHSAYPSSSYGTHVGATGLI